MSQSKEAFIQEQPISLLLFRNEGVEKKQMKRRGTVISSFPKCFATWVRKENKNNNTNTLKCNGCENAGFFMV